MKKYTLNDTIDLPMLKDKVGDERYFKDLFNAIIKVPDTYIKYFSNLGDEYKRHLERVFAYELYHQWSNLQSDPNLVINGEVFKLIEWIPVSYKNTQIEKGVYPDLVLHASQGKDDNQKMICEIKRKEHSQPAALFADLLKLSCYLRNGFYGFKPFDYGIFILVYKKELEQLVIKDGTTIKWGNKKYTFGEYKKEFKSTFGRFVCITYNGEKDSSGKKYLEYETLEKLLER